MIKCTHKPYKTKLMAVARAAPSLPHKGTMARLSRKFMLTITPVMTDCAPGLLLCSNRWEKGRYPA